MKEKIILLCIVFTALSGQCQSSLGIGSPGPDFPEPSAEQKAKLEQNLKIRLSGGQPLRMVDGKVYNVLNSELWRPVHGILNQKDGSLLILQSSSNVRYAVFTAITNYVGNALDRESVTVIAIRVGNYDFAGALIALWD